MGACLVPKSVVGINRDASGKTMEKISYVTSLNPWKILLDIPIFKLHLSSRIRISEHGAWPGTPFLQALQGHLVPAQFQGSFPDGSVVKNPSANAGDTSWIPALGRSPGEENGKPLQYSCLENPIDRGAWRAAVHRVTNSRP